MTSSVALRKRSNARRIECCFASSREKTVICCGNPISPDNSRRTKTFPSDPVPPVTNTRLSVSMISPELVISRGILAHLLDHLWPCLRRPTRFVTESIRVETTVADERIIRPDLYIQFKGLFH